ncbi:glycosyltransferase family 39 protein [Candidatus Woesebacteria bacterium]|nr:glycosyltransferase family 39 protein [Candidatus Woesebacteria bacterium]
MAPLGPSFDECPGKSLGGYLDKQIRMGKLLELLRKIKFNWMLFVFLVFQRIILILVTYLIVTSNPQYYFLKPFTKFIETFARRWDGNSYLFIAEHGYVTKGPEAGFIVFPPIYPLLVKIVNVIFSNYEFSAFLLSNVFFIASCFVFYKLLKLDFTEKFSRIVIVLLSIFPTSYFFSTGYPESLFIFLSMLSFYFARKNKWILASIFCMIATLTRPFGAVIWPALFLLWVKENKKPNNLIFLILGLATSAITYFGINFYLFNNPLAFQRFLSSTWQKSFQFPWIGLIDSWKRGFGTGYGFEYRFYIGFTEAIASSIAYVFAFLGLSKKILPNSYYAAFLLLGVVFFTSTNFILSSPRYLLSLFPFFIILTKVLNNKLTISIWVVISIALGLYFSTILARGMWAF